MSIFSSIRSKKPKMTAFDLSYENKFTADFGKLYPVLLKEVLPGDKWKVNTTSLVRFSPLVAPILQNIDVYVHYFYVPNRLLMRHKDWETFITGGKSGNDTAPLPHATLNQLATDNSDTDTYWSPGSLADFLGYPVDQIYPSGSGVSNVETSTISDITVNTFPFRAYQLIWQEYYRDQNLTDEIFDFESSNADEQQNSRGWIENLTTLRRRCWKKDYFTSSLPFVQRGNAASLGISQDANVDFSGKDGGVSRYNQIFYVESDGTMKDVQAYLVSLPDFDATKSHGLESNIVQGGPGTGMNTVMSYVYTAKDGTEKHFPVVINNTPNMSADLSSASSVTVNDIRRSFDLQTWLEKNARGGSRLIEQLFSHFGVISSDARLQRPEYLGGGMQPVVISEVLQTSSSDATTPQGNQAGHAISSGQTMSFQRKFEEHGYIMGIMSVLPRASYCQGLSKSLTRLDKFDYAWPEFAHLGEQPILNRELYLNSLDPSSNPSGTFGYQSVYSDYKFSLDEIHGQFKTSLNYWHQGRIFANQPNLNSDFVEAHPSNRIFAVTDDSKGDPLQCELFHNIVAVRPLPRYGTPASLIL